MAMQINRPTPLLPASARRTFSILMPTETHWRKATCREIDCPRFLKGWKAQVEVMTPQQIHLIKAAKYRYRELRVALGETWWLFEAGQTCFQADLHRIQLGKPELFVVRDGDWRGNPRRTPTIRHKRPEFWVEQFSEHQAKLAKAREQG